MPTRRRLGRVRQSSADLLFLGPIMLYSLRTRLLIRRRGLDTFEKPSGVSKSFRFRARTERKSTRKMRESCSGSSLVDAEGVVPWLEAPGERCAPNSWV